jgi:ABC-type transporter MlaC component
MSAEKKSVKKKSMKKMSVKKKSVKKDKKRSLELPSELQNKHKKPLRAVIQAFVGGKLETNQVSKCLKKAAKAIDEPKKPRKTNAYILFAKENRDGVIAEMSETNKDTTLGDVAKELGKMWGGLSDEQKQRFKNKALKEYKEKLKKWEEENKERNEKKPKSPGNSTNAKKSQKKPKKS